MAMTDEQRKARHERWEGFGLDRVKHDLLNGGYRLVGGSPEVREAAWEWVRSKEAAAALAQAPALVSAPAAIPAKEILTLKPSLWGVGIDLKAAWRALQEWWHRRA